MEQDCTGDEIPGRSWEDPDFDFGLLDCPILGGGVVESHVID